MRRCRWCGKHMTFEGAAELAGTAIVRLVDPKPNRLVTFFTCECGSIESFEQEHYLAPRVGPQIENTK
jgi:predicted nucleic-acid-binding Zn-ribbon protein